MIGNGKAVGLIPDTLQKEESSGVGLEHDRILAAGQKDALGGMGDFFGKRVPLGPHLGQTNDIDLSNPQLSQHSNGDAELAFAAIYHEEVWQVVFR